jgi:hypothetical protein
MNIADRYQIEEVIAGQNEDEWKSFTSDKNYTYVVDQQNGNYSNQVSWDLTSVVNQNSWLSIQEGYILMPFSTTLALGALAAFTTTPTSFSQNQVSLKNNFISFVDSMQLFVNGEQLIDQTSFSSMPINVMDMLTMSQDNLAVEGEALNIQPDTTTSIRFSGANSTVNGDGYTNNQFLTAANVTTLTGQDYSTFNDGLKKRNLNTNLAPAATGAAANGWPPALGSTVNNFTQILAPYVSSATNTTAVQTTWNYVVYLPLKRLSDLLFKYPLVKGSQIRLILNFNAGVTTVTTSTTSGAAAMVMTSYASTAGNINPVLLNASTITSTAANQIITTTAGALTLTTAIQTQAVARVATTTAQKGYAALPNCRIYIPNYKINPTYEERILSNRVQKIRYIDWYQQPIINVANGASYSQVLTTALTNVKACIILPFQNGSNANTPPLFSTFKGSQWQSCFDTAGGGTTFPGAMLAFQNFNIQVSGINIFNLNANYNYDIWAQEVQRLGLNGTLSKELNSGLVSLNSWLWSPFVVADLSRRTESADKTYQSVIVQGTNNSGVAVDFYCFLAFEKEIEIDCLTGATKRIF